MLKIALSWETYVLMALLFISPISLLSHSHSVSLTRQRQSLAAIFT